MLINPELLICPFCKNKLSFEEDYYCKSCNKKFKQRNNKLYFIDVNEETVDKLDKLKYFFKQYPWFYNLLINVVSPVYMPLHLKKFLKKELNTSNKNVLNLGSGNTKISKKIINVDIYDYDNVDLICDMAKLPIANYNIDIIISLAVLEHVPDPKAIADEIYRVLKPGGKIFIYIPFIQGYHASPYDYQRYTISGIKHLFKNFNIIETKCGSGPTSGFLWIFQEWLAILLSFGIKPLYRFLHLVIMGITFPLKFIDVLLIHHPYSKNIASGFTIIAERKKTLNHS